MSTSILSILQECNRFFVYGTLKRGWGNNRLLDGAEFLGTTVTKGKYIVLGSGFPYAVPASSFEGNEAADEYLLPLRGEVYEVDDPLNVLYMDELEGHPNWYKRSIVELEEHGPAWLYEMDEVYSLMGRRLATVHEGAYQWP